MHIVKTYSCWEYLHRYIYVCMWQTIENYHIPRLNCHVILRYFLYYIVVHKSFQRMLQSVGHSPIDKYNPRNGIDNGRIDNVFHIISDV